MNERRLIHWHELESLADSVFAKQKADRVINVAVLSGDPDPMLDELLLEHEQLDYRLVPADLLRDIVFSMKAANDEWHKLMVMANQLRTEEGRAEVERIEALIDSARRDAGIE